MKNCKCVPAKIVSVLVIIGALNWGLVGAGMLFGSTHDMSWNLVGMILGTGTIAAIVYLLVGIAAIAKIVGCKCKTCKACMVDGATTDASAKK